MSTLGQINVTQALRNAIFNSEPSGSPTNVILNYEKICEKNREKLNQLFETLSYHRVLMDNHNFKFIELRETWLSSQQGTQCYKSAILIRNLVFTFDYWK